MLGRPWQQKRLKMQIRKKSSKRMKMKQMGASNGRMMKRQPLHLLLNERGPRDNSSDIEGEEEIGKRPTTPTLLKMRMTKRQTFTTRLKQTNRTLLPASTSKTSVTTALRRACLELLRIASSKKILQGTQVMTKSSCHQSIMRANSSVFQWRVNLTRLSTASKIMNRMRIPSDTA